MSTREPGARTKLFKWGFLSVAGVVLFLLVVGQAVGTMLEQYPPGQAFVRFCKGRGVGPIFSAMGMKDWVFTGFLVSASIYVILQRSAIRRFFLSMHAGVTLVTLVTIATALGCLVPQIDRFEDPDMRVTEANYEENYSAFRWAEGYFLYHLMRPYGIGMPEVVIPPGADEGLERYAMVYGEVEAKNRRKLMKGAFSGRSKSEEIGAFIDRHDAAFRKAFDVCTFLQFNRTYKSNWFATLMGLIGVGTLINLTRGDPRKLFSLQKVGFLTAHVGIITLLVGGFASKLFTDRGMINLFLDGPSKDTYASFWNEENEVRMPFAVRLDHFARKEWKALEVRSMRERFTGAPPRFTLWPDRVIPLHYEPDGNGEMKHTVELRVVELHDRAMVAQPTVTEGSEGDGEGANPIVELEIPNVDPIPGHTAMMEGETRLIHVPPGYPDLVYRDPDDAFRLAFTYREDPGPRFPVQPDVEFGTMYIQVLGADDVTPVPVRVRLNEPTELPMGYSVRVYDVTSDFQMRNDRTKVLEGSGDVRPIAERPDRYAACWVEIQPPEGPAERRVVVEVLDPVEYGLQENYTYKDVVVRMKWDRWSSPGPPRYVLSQGEDGRAVLAGEDGSRRDVSAGEDLPLPGDYRTKLTRLLEYARWEKNIEFLPNRLDEDGWNASFYDKEPRGLVLDVVHFPGTEREVVETISMATTDVGQSDLWQSGGGDFELRFLENAEGFPHDWRSVLSIIGKDAEGRPYTVDTGSKKEREIRVNDYFHYNAGIWPGGGYRFFQTNAIATLPNYSGIGVVYDPGIPVVLLGMYTIIAGTLLAFIVKPMVLMWRQASTLREKRGMA